MSDLSTTINVCTYFKEVIPEDITVHFGGVKSTGLIFNRWIYVTDDKVDKELITWSDTMSVSQERAPIEDPKWDADDLTGKNKQALKFYDYFLMQVDNPKPDPYRPLDDQLLKFYDYMLAELNNPANHHMKCLITTNYEVEAINPPEYTDELLFIEDTFEAEIKLPPDPQDATIDEFLVGIPYIAPAPCEQIVWREKMRITCDGLKLYIKNPTVFRSLSRGVMRMALATTMTTSPNKTAELIDGLKISSFIIDPDGPAGHTEYLKIEAWFRVDAEIIPDGGGDGGDTDQGLADAEEQTTEYVRLGSWFKTSETVHYFDVLAMATYAGHMPNANAIFRGGLKLNFKINDLKGGAEKLDSLVKITDFLKISTQETKNILEFVRISDFYRAEGGTSEEEYTTYVINEDNETTRYEHWPFESYAAFKGVHFGCGPDGIYELTGDDDNGEPIAAMINFGKQSFGSSQMKRVPYVYASLASDGDLYMQVSYTDDNVYMYPARKVDEYNATVRFDLGRGIKANYLNFELYNENGSKFDLRNVWIYLTELSRRI